MINTTIGKYKITRLIGEGGMASVYEAEHEMLGTKVAIKVLNPILSANAQIRERFKNEAKVMATLNHPNITRVMDFDEQPQYLSIVMEYLEGEDLSQKIKRNGALSEKHINEVFTQTLSAFQYAHDKGIVHRDIKPSNIFILPDGQVKILDFGIAKLFGQSNEMTQTGTQMGTPTYMSPEQVKADKTIDHRSDIYSLGVTLYYAVNGKAPYNSTTESQFDIFNKIVYEPLPEISNNSKYSGIIKKACAKNREERFQNCNAWLSELNNSASAHSSAAPIGDDKTVIANKEDATTIEKVVKKEPFLIGSILSNEGKLKYGFINRQGNWIIQPMFDRVSQFDEKELCSAEINGKDGFINHKGNWIIQPIFDVVGQFDEQGFCRVKINGKYGFINRQGNWIIQPMFDSVGQFDEKELCYASINGKYGSINRQGNWIIQPMFDDVGEFDEKELCSASINGKYGFINHQGNWIIQPMFDRVGQFDEKELCSAEINGKDGFINHQGNWIIQPMFDGVGQFDEQGFCRVKINGKYGFINRLGNWIIQPMFDDVGFRFNNNELCSASINGQYGFINRQGNWIIQPKFDSVFSVSEYSIVDVNEKYGLIDRFGNEIVPPQFVLLEPTNSPNVFKASRSNQYGYINEQGNWIVEPKFDYVLSDKMGEEMIWDEDDEEWVYDSNSTNEIYYENTKVISFFLPLVEKCKVYCNENIPSKKLNNFILNYNPDFFEECEFLVYYDDTVFGKGDNGFLIVKREERLYIFLSIYLEFKRAFCFSSDSGNDYIQDASYKGNKIVIDVISDELETKTLEFKFTHNDLNAALFEFLNFFVDRPGKNDIDDFDF